jgi:HK97 family phage portal protein
MALWSGWFSRQPAQPRTAVQDGGGGVIIQTPDQLADYLRAGDTTKSGVQVTPNKAMQVAAVYACVRIISSSVATLPLDIKRRVDAKNREDASDTVLWSVIRRKPNRWQKPAQFRRMLQAHVLLRGNAYCLIVRSRGEVRELIPLHPGRMEVKQQDDLTLVYEYQRKNGSKETFKQSEIFHLFGLTLDGIKGVTPITYARETIGLSLAMEDHGASTFKNGLRVGGVLEHPQKLGQESRNNLKASLDEYRAGGESEGRFLILEEGMKPSELAMTAQDAQWLEARKFSRTDICMFFGVPPFMVGDTEKSTSWGSGIEQQKDGYVTFTLDDHLVMWEEAITSDLTTDEKIYARFNRNALVKGNINDRWNSYVKALQWGVRSPNEIRALEDDNPRDGGDIYYPPPNTAGGDQEAEDSSKPKKETDE